MVYGCMVYGVWRMVYGAWCMVCGVWCMVYGTHLMHPRPRLAFYPVVLYVCLCHLEGWGFFKPILLPIDKLQNVRLSCLPLV
jgi:hypothetical protein